jgi:hypothetical protein
MTVGWLSLISSMGLCIPSVSLSNPFCRNARAKVESFWLERLPQTATEKKEAILALFSEEKISQDLDTLKGNSAKPIHGKGKTKDTEAFIKNIPLLYAMQTSIRELFNIIPQADDNTFDWDGGQMSQVFTNTTHAIHQIPTIANQVSSFTFLLSASHWELARAYYLSFYWFSTIGPQLVSTLVHWFQSGSEHLKNERPLEKLAHHVCQYIQAVSNNNRGGECLHSATFFCIYMVPQIRNTSVNFQLTYMAWHLAQNPLSFLINPKSSLPATGLGGRRNGSDSSLLTCSSLF